MPNRITHFEIHASDPEKVAAFYADCFGWDIKKWEGGQFEYWLVMTGAKGEPDGINGGLLRRKGEAAANGQPVNAFVCTIVTDDYDGVEAKILEKGGTVAVPKGAMTGMAWQGYYKDPDGNIFGLHMTDVNAK